MGVGFQAFNSSGVFQVDGEYANPSLLRKGSAASVFDSAYNRGTLTLSIAPDEILAVACSSAHVAIVARSATSVVIHTDQAAGGDVISYWIFGAGAIASSTSTFGMQVFNSAGQLIFDAQKKPLSVVQKLSGGSSGGVNVTLTSGKTYAVMVQQARIQYDRGKSDVDYGTVRMWVDSVKVAANVVYVQQKLILDYDGQVSSSSGWEGFWDNSVTSQHVIIDVTNY